MGTVIYSNERANRSNGSGVFVEEAFLVETAIKAGLAPFGGTALSELKSYHNAPKRYDIDSKIGQFAGNKV